MVALRASSDLADRDGGLKGEPTKSGHPPNLGKEEAADVHGQRDVLDMLKGSYLGLLLEIEESGLRRRQRYNRSPEKRKPLMGTGGGGVGNGDVIMKWRSRVEGGYGGTCHGGELT
ncbi:hypothetical protein CRG98_045350 [Punica granatum]|uniref:Uncharacterized protein n=1 Tax=Punica granatum TaxID=22663 RepID=A0A2I0HRA0_PUNGR|nr:hypothetical protein CRG98_045350 [Punica granatum]